MELNYQNIIPVAAHRGNSAFFPENTMAAFRSAAEIGPDMIETDLHMTVDGELIIMHDHKVDRTTDGTGLIRQKTLAQMRALDAGSWKGEEFQGEKVPTFVEFLEFFKDYPDMLFNIELKDYPADSGKFAYESCDKAIALMDAYGITERSVVNTWSGVLNEYITNTYGERVRIHAYAPEQMGLGQKQLAYNYAYCMCHFGTETHKVPDLRLYDFCRSYGVEPWAYFKDNNPALYDEAISKGVRLFTANDPAWVMAYLRAKGLHS